MAKESVFLPLKKVRGRMSSEGENNAEWKQVTSGQSLPVDDEKIVQQNEGVYCEDLQLLLLVSLLHIQGMQKQNQVIKINKQMK